MVKVFIVLLFSTTLLSGREVDTYIACGGYSLYVRVNIPSNPGTAVVFVPNIGYMDHNGSTGDDFKTYPGKGVFDYWSTQFYQRNFVTIQFDKQGVGKSGGSLRDNAEHSLMCVVKSLDTLGIHYDGDYLFYTYKSGIDVIRNILGGLLGQGKNLPLGVVQQGGLGADFYGSEEQYIPVLNLLADTTYLFEKIRRKQLRNEFLGDKKSKVVVFEGLDEYMCDNLIKVEKEECVYSSPFQKTVLKWVENFQRSTISPNADGFW